MAKDLMGETNEARTPEEVFEEKWAGMDDDQRLSHAQMLRTAQSGSDRKTREYSEENKELKAKLAKNTGKADDAVEGITGKAEALRKIEESQERKFKILQQCVSGEISAPIALQLAELENGVEVVGMVFDEIDRVADERTNKRMLSGNGTGGAEQRSFTRHDLDSMSAGEVARIPHEFTSKLLDEVNNEII